MKKELNNFTKNKNKESKVIEFLKTNNIKFENLTKEYGYFRLRVNNNVDSYEDIYYDSFSKCWQIKKYILKTANERKNEYLESINRINKIYKNGMCNLRNEY